MSNITTHKVPVFATRKRDGSQVTVKIGPKHYRKSENVEEIYFAVNDYKADPNSEKLEALNNLLNPNLAQVERLTVAGILEKDDKNQYFLGGSSVPIPKVLVEKIKEFLDNEWPIEPLVNFWYNCVLNPNHTARDDFFNYVEKFGITITDMGYAILYKAVTHKKVIKKQEDLAAFVAESYTAVKRMKKGLARFNIYKNEKEGTFRSSEGEIQEGETIAGNLKDLHKNIENLSAQSQTVYTDKHTRTMNIKLGIPVTMDRALCDSNEGVECSRGLHIGSYQYVKRFGKQGDTIFVCLVNPKDIVAIPKRDTSKIRCCQYLPYAIMEKGESKEWEELPSTYFEDDYLDYEMEEVKNLIDMKVTSDEERKIATMRLQLLGKASGNVGTRQIADESENEVTHIITQGSLPQLAESTITKKETSKSKEKSYSKKAGDSIIKIEDKGGANWIHIVKDFREVTGATLIEGKRFANETRVATLPTTQAKKLKKLLTERGCVISIA